MVNHISWSMANHGWCMDIYTLNLYKWTVNFVPIIHVQAFSFCCLLLREYIVWCASFVWSDTKPANSHFHSRPINRVPTVTIQFTDFFSGKALHYKRRFVKDSSALGCMRNRPKEIWSSVRTGQRYLGDESPAALFGVSIHIEVYPVAWNHIALLHYTYLHSLHKHTYVYRWHMYKLYKCGTINHWRMYSQRPLQNPDIGVWDAEAVISHDLSRLEAIVRRL